jgi:hypothetical protein
VKRTTNALCAAVIGAGLLLVGCSDDGSEPAQDGDETVSTQAQEGDDSGAGVEDREAEPIVEQTVALPGSPDDKAAVGVQSLTVEGKTMVLRLVVTPDFASVSDSDTVSLGDAMDVGAQFFGVSLRLLDRENLKEYSVIHGNTDWWASAAQISARNGEPMYAFAVFAAPEDDIDTVDVRLNEQWPEFTDVPITR